MYKLTKHRISFFAQVAGFCGSIAIFFAVIPPLTAQAQSCPTDPQAYNKAVSGYSSTTTPCIGAPPSDVDITGKKDANVSIIDKYINPVIAFLSGAVGLAAVISYVIAGIQYSSSADDPQKVAAAKARLRRTTIAIVAFLFLFSFLQWVVPGGLLNKTGFIRMSGF